MQHFWRRVGGKPEPGRREKVISLEIARFLAAFCVATAHIVSFVGSVHQGTIMGGFDLPPITSVMFFFVLSGFVIQGAHAADFGKPKAILRYFWLRFWRIYPLYWLSLVTELFFLWPNCSHDYLVKILTLDPFTDKIVEINPPAWSLRFEITFYLMFGLSLLPYIGRVILGLWLFLTLWSWYPFLVPFKQLLYALNLRPPVSWHFLGLHETLFFIGLGAAWLYLRLQPARGLLWAMLGFGGVALLLLTRSDQWGYAYPTVIGEPFLGLSFAAVIYAFAALERGGHLHVSKRWGALGAASYPLYLFHPSIIFLGDVFFYKLPKMKQFVSPTPLFLGMMAASLALTLVITYLFDRPVQHLVRKIF